MCHARCDVTRDMESPGVTMSRGHVTHLTPRNYPESHNLPAPNNWKYASGLKFQQGEAES